MDSTPAPDASIEPRFPSGRWAGFWEQAGRRAKMELHLTFSGGRIYGDGRDLVGDFVLSGGYTGLGVCSVLKTYLGQHDVDYDGAAAQPGIRGEWRLRSGGTITDAGAFHIWPLGDEEGVHDQAEASVALPV